MQLLTTRISPELKTKKASGKVWEQRWKSLDWQLVLMQAADAAGMVESLSRPQWGTIAKGYTRLSTAFTAAALSSGLTTRDEDVNINGKSLYENFEPILRSIRCALHPRKASDESLPRNIGGIAVDQPLPPCSLL